MLNTSLRRSVSRLLIVEDDASLLHTLKDIFFNEEFEVIGCSGASEALQKLKSEEFGVLIVDLELPDSRGSQLIRQVKALNPRSRIIIYTGSGSFESAKDAVNMGVFAYLEKGGDPGELIRQVHLANETYLAETLRDNEDQLRLITDNLPALVAYIDSAQRYRYANPAYANFFGRSVPEIVGLTVQTVIGHSIYGKIEERIRAVLTGEKVEFETWFLHPDGEDHCFNSRYVPHFSADGHIQGFFVLVIDVTEKRKLQEMLQNRERELAHANRVNALGEMVAGISHEVAQPLFTIANFAAACTKLLEEREDESLAEVLQWTGLISEQTVRCNQIIHRLRNFASKKTQILSTIDLNEVVGLALELIEIDIQRSNVRVRFEPTHPMPKFAADQVQLQQVLINLIQNAIQAMESTPVEERELYLKTDVSAASIELIVRDSGKGLQGNEEQIFDPFFTTKSNGLGLGLAISRTIVNAHGGRMWAEPQIQRGAEFHVMFPSRKGDGDDS